MADANPRAPPAGRGVMIGRDLANRQAREREQRLAAVAERRHGQGVSGSPCERLEIVHHIDEKYVGERETINFKRVAAEFTLASATISSIWRGRDDVETRRRGFAPAPGPPPRAEDDRILDIIFHPPRTDLPAPDVVADEDEGKENAPIGLEEEEEEEEEGEKKKKALSPLLSTLIRIVRGATRTLIIAVYCFSDKKLAKEVIAAANRGVTVKVYMDYGQATRFRVCPAEFIKTNKIQINFRRQKSAFMHVKYVVADGIDVAVGSANFSDKDLERNNVEVLLHLRGRHVASLFEADFVYRWKDSCCLLRSMLYEEQPRGPVSH